MILVDSSVWIDFFRGRTTAEVERLDALLGSEPLLVGDLILAEVLQGIPNEAEFRRVRSALGAFVQVDLVGPAVALASARNYRKLRGLGITVRKTIDTLIATACLTHGYRLLHSDRDFDAFEQHLGLQVVRGD